MDSYIAELDDKKQIAAVWVKTATARAPRVFDPKKHIFDLQSAKDFAGAPKADIVRWLKGTSAGK